MHFFKKSSLDAIDFHRLCRAVLTGRDSGELSGLEMSKCMYWSSGLISFRNVEGEKAYQL